MQQSILETKFKPKQIFGTYQNYVSIDVFMISVYVFSFESFASNANILPQLEFAATLVSERNKANVDKYFSFSLNESQELLLLSIYTMMYV